MSGFVRARIDETLKEEASVVLDAIGLTVSDVVRMLLTRIAREKALPVDLVVPNAATIAAMEEGRMLLKDKTRGFENAQEMFDALGESSSKKKKSKTAASI
ncbi:MULTISPECIES: type II toxin-antitoxin system RelB/DinJ family antitoxin [Komagataeibacter]|nr:MULTISPECIES: type II toxin-antitoxin system RelB/DinJ family antitoxin [Komagataeibacter]